MKSHQILQLSFVDWIAHQLHQHKGEEKASECWTLVSDCTGEELTANTYRLQWKERGNEINWELDGAVSRETDNRRTAKPSWENLCCGQSFFSSFVPLPFFFHIKLLDKGHYHYVEDLKNELPSFLHIHMLKRKKVLDRRTGI